MTVLPYVDSSIKIVPDRYLSGAEDVSAWLRQNVSDGVTIQLPTGSEIMISERVTFEDISNVTFTGAGTFKASGTINRAMFELIGGCTNWMFLNTIWDCNQTDQDDTYQPYQSFKNAALFVTGTGNSDIVLYGCKVQDIYTDGMWFYQGTGKISLDRCEFTAAAHRKQQAGNLIQISQWVNSDVQITHCDFTCGMPVDALGAFDPTFGFGGIILSTVYGGKNRINFNTFTYVGRNNTTQHRVGCIDFYDSCKNFEIQGNHIRSNWVALRVSRTQDVDFFANTVEAYGSPTDSGVIGVATGILTGVTVGVAQRVKIRENTILYVGPNDYAGSVAVQFSCSYNDSAIIDCEATHNTVEDFNQAFNMTGSVDGLKIVDNTTRGCVSGVVRGEYGGAGGTASNRKNNGVAITDNHFLRNATTGQGCASGISWALPNPYTGLQTPMTIERNDIQCHDQASSNGIITFGSDVFLRDNNVDKCNIAFYTRGQSGNKIRTKGCYATNANQLEDFYLAEVTREQPIADATSLKLDNLSPVAVFSAQRKLMASYAGTCMEIREAATDALKNIPFTLRDVTDVLEINAHTTGTDGYINTLYDQSGNANHMLQPTPTAQLLAATAGAYRQLGGRFLPLGSSITHMTGGSFTLTDFTFFVVARFSNSDQAVFNIGAAANVARLHWSGGVLNNYRISNPATIDCPFNQLVQISGYSSDALRRIWLNGVEGTPNATAVSATISAAPMWYSSMSATLFRMAGYIGEVIIVPGTVSDSNRQTIEENQKAYWGIS